MPPVLGAPPAAIPAQVPALPAPSHRAMVLGMFAYGIGVALMVLTFAWALNAVSGRQAALPGSTLTRSTSVYTGWGSHQLLYALGLLLMTFAGWLIAGQGARLFGGARRGRGHGPGMAVGGLVFCGGIGLVVLVFLTAAHYFGANPVPAPASTGASEPDYISWALGGVFRIIVLGVMALNGALVAGKGGQLFLECNTKNI